MFTKRMDVFVIKLAGRRAFQLIRNFLDREPMPTHDEMDMIGQNGAGPNRKRRSICVLPETAPHRASLNAGKADGRVFQDFFGTMTKVYIVTSAGKRSPR